MASKRKPHRMKVKMNDGIAVAKILIQHPMETGRRQDKVTGEKIPRHFIRELRCEHNGETVLNADWNWGVARDPYLSFHILDARPGDRVRVEWIDSLGQEDAVETTVS